MGSNPNPCYGVKFGGGVPIFQLSGAELIDQGPTAIDTPHQVTFGAGSSSADNSVTIAADGSISFVKSSSYLLKTNLTYKRSGSAGVCRIFVRFLVNGVALGASGLVELENSKTALTKSVDIDLPIQAGQVLTMEIVRDSSDSGTNDGGLSVETPAAAGWAITPSAAITIFEISNSQP